MSGPFSMYVSYQQLCVFEPSLAEPFNAWKDEHVAQGFSWRPGSVCFGTLDPDGQVEIAFGSSSGVPAPAPATVRAIVVPIAVPDDGRLEIATITESKIVQAPPHTNGLLFEAGLGGRRDQYRITFLKGPSPQPEIVVADAELTPPAMYLMEAEPG